MKNFALEEEFQSATPHSGGAPQWYQAVSDESLEQGDCLSDCQILVPQYRWNESAKKPALWDERQIYDVIVLNQSCDLVQNKLTHVLVSRLQ